MRVGVLRRKKGGVSAFDKRAGVAGRVSAHSLGRASSALLSKRPKDGKRHTEGVVTPLMLVRKLTGKPCHCIMTTSSLTLPDRNGLLPIENEERFVEIMALLLAP